MSSLGGHSLAGATGAHQGRLFISDVLEPGELL